ncbi:MAG: hypothetical protein F9K19_15615 [Rhizobiaceae bacterium]|nr:MAG: hypothetical protein F9K19_15615 [Rhizobiaceae bacterium]
MKTTGGTRDFSLPAANLAARGLHVTNDEYQALLDWIRGQEWIDRAWVFGSCFRGYRRLKGEVEPPDIDVAVELRSVPADETVWAQVELKTRARAFNKNEGMRVDLQIAGDPTVASYLAEGATLVFERRG